MSTNPTDPSSQGVKAPQELTRPNSVISARMAGENVCRRMKLGMADPLFAFLAALSSADRQCGM
jgi:hypothetical protein